MAFHIGIRELYVRECLHNIRGRTVGITYKKKKPMKFRNLFILEWLQAVNTYKPQH